MTAQYSRIAGTGRYLPERVMTNADLEKIVDTTDEWIRSRTGIERRHIAADGETTADLAEQAARNAMEAAGVVPGDIDFIVVGTTTPDVVFPNVGCLVQQRLGVRGCPAFSVEAACSGFIYALSIADRFVATGQATRALVIGAETLSRMTDYEDRATCVIFGDGAGAAVLEPSDEPGIQSCHLRADGRYKDLLYHPYGVSRQRGPDDTEGPYIHMRGNEVFKVAVKSLESIVDETLEANNIDTGDIDWLIPHQANFRIIHATAKRLGMSMDKVILTLQDQGNTSAASVPMALDVAVRDGRVKRGDLLLLEAFGGGFTWGSSLIRY
ncbi:MAG: ketoacyl-ACP synthase III [Gammaproteobacteria bacterium]|nr:ketoacyl-ACP synthase III [Gammaproteobacteria bacterium]MBT8443731.1 ketoacyl-ACP synthase III [Gammaproteobacteria bacterium]NND36306.1 ketoacyl-ACP synthase III [Gammaproteobacteria bacterium]